MERVLILYATREGHTRRVAEHAAARLLSRGLLVDITNVREKHIHVDFSLHSAALVAASVHLGTHESEMVRFVRSHRTELERLPAAAFVSVSLSEVGVERTGEPPERREKYAADVQMMLDRFIKETGWHPVRVKPIAGAILYSRYNPIVRFAMKRVAKSVGASTDTSHDYEFTNWTEFDCFVDEFADQVLTLSSALSRSVTN